MKLGQKSEQDLWIAWQDCVSFGQNSDALGRQWILGVDTEEIWGEKKNEKWNLFVVLVEVGKKKRILHHIHPNMHVPN